MAKSKKKKSGGNGVLMAVGLGVSFVILLMSPVSHDFFRNIWKKTVAGLFVGIEKSTPVESQHAANWDKVSQDLEGLGEWMQGAATANIEVIRPESFEIERLGENPSRKPTVEFTITRIQGKQRLTKADLGRRILLRREPENVQARLESITEEKDDVWKVTVSGVAGKGKVGLSIDGLPATFFDVNLRKVWAVPVNGTIGGKVIVGREGRSLVVGDCIMGSGEYCGYRVLSVSPNCVWFEAFYEDTPPAKTLPENSWPDFARVDFNPPVPPTGRLVYRKGRYFWPNETIRLPYSGYMINLDRLIQPNAVHFRFLTADQKFLTDLVCVVVRPML